MNGNPSNSQGTTSSPSQSVNASEGSSERGQLAENGALMDVIRQQSAKKKGRINELAAPQTVVAAPVKAATRPADPYKESVRFGGSDSRRVEDDEGVYEPVEAPTNETV